MLLTYILTYVSRVQHVSQPMDLKMTELINEQINKSPLGLLLKEENTEVVLQNRNKETYVIK